MISLKFPGKTKHTIQTFNEVRYSFGGTPHNVRPANRTTKERVRWQFDNLTRTMINTLITDLCANVGKTVVIMDENNDLWQGIIVSATIPFRQLTRDPCSMWSTEFEMEGTKQ